MEGESYSVNPTAILEDELDQFRQEWLQELTNRKERQLSKATANTKKQKDVRVSLISHTEVHSTNVPNRCTMLELSSLDCSVISPFANTTTIQRYEMRRQEDGEVDLENG
jgi:hypothetical protein